jgi:plasmid stabilization system protein ParE
VRLVFNRAAAAEYCAALDWYRRHSESAARDFVTAVRTGVNAIRVRPKPWPILTGDYRSLVLERFPFALIYRERSDCEIEVVAVAHASRNPSYWRSRRPE